jgi:hypothetical protein
MKVGETGPWRLERIRRVTNTHQDKEVSELHDKKRPSGEA